MPSSILYLSLRQRRILGVQPGDDVFVRVDGDPSGIPFFLGMRIDTHPDTGGTLYNYEATSRTLASISSSYVIREYGIDTDDDEGQRHPDSVLRGTQLIGGDPTIDNAELEYSGNWYPGEEDSVPASLDAYGPGYRNRRVSIASRSQRVVVEIRVAGPGGYAPENERGSRVVFPGTIRSRRIPTNSDWIRDNYPGRNSTFADETSLDYGDSDTSEGSSSPRAYAITVLEVRTRATASEPAVGFSERVARDFQRIEAATERLANAVSNRERLRRAEAEEVERQERLERRRVRDRERRARERADRAVQTRTDRIANGDTSLRERPFPVGNWTGGEDDGDAGWYDSVANRTRNSRRNTL